MLSDIYSAEKQMTKSLPRMARASTNRGLRSAFEMHLEEARGQIERIDRVVEATGIKLKRIRCLPWRVLTRKVRSRSTR
jgi:ferritin-like metal-binding protein YciE